MHISEKTCSILNVYFFSVLDQQRKKKKIVYIYIYIYIYDCVYTLDSEMLSFGDTIWVLFSGLLPKAGRTSSESMVLSHSDFV